MGTVKGKIRFINEDEKNPNKVIITFEVTPENAMKLSEEGFTLKENNYKGVKSMLAKGSILKNYVDIYKKNSMGIERVNYDNSNLTYGAECVFKYHANSYNYLGRTGTSMKIDSIAIIKTPVHNTFSATELEEVFKE